MARSPRRPNVDVTVPDVADAEDATSAADRVDLAEAGSAGSDLSQTGLAQTGLAQTGVAQTGVAQTGVALTGLAGTGIAIVDMAEADLDEVMAIERDTAMPGWSRNIFVRELAQPDTRRYLIARLADDGEQSTMLAHDREQSGVLGYGGVQFAVDEAHITTLTVRSDVRRRGIATRLLVSLLREARAHGARAATLEVRTDNAAARALYQALWFAPVGVRPDYYDGHADALIMWVHDIDSEQYGQLLSDRSRGDTGAGRARASGQRGDEHLAAVELRRERAAQAQSADRKD